jgi:hypothetical protein
MMRWHSFLACALMWPALVLAHGHDERLGVAGSAGTSMCAVLQATDAHAGERVAVVDPDSPQRVLWATLERPLTDACATWQRRSDLPGRAFVLALAPGSRSDEGFIGIVVRGTSSVATRRAKVVARLMDGSILRFHACTSSEGLHLSAWPSAHMAGQPLWHAYVYLGYDVEPTCSDAGTRDAASARDRAVRAGTAR